MDAFQNEVPVSAKKSAAAVVIQKYIRRWLAQKERQQRVKEKLQYEARMEELCQNAYLQMVDRYRKEQERKRAKELEEEQRQKLENARKKRMLECAYEGKDNEMRLLLKEVVMDEDNARGVGYDDIGQATRLRHKMQLIECRDPNNNSALSEACIGGSLAAVLFLIAEGADVNSKGQYGRTPLYRAAFGGHFEVVQVLLQHGADPRLCTEDGQRPSDVATEGTIHELLQAWNIEETDRLLKQISFYRNQQGEQYNKGAQAMLESLKQETENLEKNYQVSQKKVIHDAESHLESLKLEMNRALERLQEAKLELRKEQRKDNRNSIVDPRPGIVCSLRDLDDVLFKDVGDRLASTEKWPLVVDPTDQASTFLRYRDTNYLNVLNPKQMHSETIRIALLGALRYGKPVVLDLMDLDNTLDTICRRAFESIKNTLLEDIIGKRITNPFV
ncbi:unnamed protein product [Echinostoma caproni]|uniref:ANK_REP_REGION domain-containing protein n=1 Tax=Echinostoma caproni TaxID=27848 RepID=A0A183AK26_9TREM|nr:unnamed protein product [Echinostoma caproni]